MTASGRVTARGTSRLASTAAFLKCKYGIAAGVCFTLAVAKRIESPALFTRKEKELSTEFKKRSFDVEVLFLEDLA